MDRSRKMAAVIAMIPLLLLVAGGLAVSHWDDEVQVTGSVAMGTFNVQMSLEDTSDNEGSLDVGHVSAHLYTYNDGDDPLDGGYNDGLYINLSNVYPGYEACIEFNVENAGTIPAALSNTSVAFNSTFDWPSYAKYFNITLYYHYNGTWMQIAHVDSIGNWQADYDFIADPLGLTTLTPGEAEYFKLCAGLTAEPVNPPESLMGQSLSFAYTLAWIQAVP